jgi:hypothetical protein
LVEQPATKKPLQPGFSGKFLADIDDREALYEAMERGEWS